MSDTSDSDHAIVTGTATLALTQPHRRRVASPITIIIESRGDARVVRIAGELDIACADRVLRRCTEDRTQHVVVDLADLTFMDCGGYQAFVAARTALVLRHRTLTLDGAVGEPRRLRELISHPDRGGSSL